MKYRQTPKLLNIVKHFFFINVFRCILLFFPIVSDIFFNSGVDAAAVKSLRWHMSVHHLTFSTSRRKFGSCYLRLSSTSS